MNRNSKLSSLVPVVAVLLLFCSVKAAPSTGENELKVTQSLNTIAAIKSAVLTTAKSSVSEPTTASTGRNASTSYKSTLSTTPVSFSSPVGFGKMIKRLFIVTAVLSLIVGLYFVMKFCRSGRRKARKYGVVKTPGDAELRPLESDDEDEDDDVTMFNRKN